MGRAQEDDEISVPSCQRSESGVHKCQLKVLGQVTVPLEGELVLESRMEQNLQQVNGQWMRQTKKKKKQQALSCTDAELMTQQTKSGQENTMR